VLPNAELHLLKRNLDLDGDDESPTDAESDHKAAQKIVKALEITEDIDIWVEWLAKSRGRL
jgi:hypothetical protein